MGKDVIHMSAAEAARDFAGVLARVCEGSKIVIEDGSRPVAVVSPAEPQPGRLLSESIALAKAHGSTVTLDGDFTRDLEEIINSRKPREISSWE